MNSEQIKGTPHFDLSMTQWLKELCYQVALMNERRTPMSEQLRKK